MFSLRPFVCLVLFFAVAHAVFAQGSRAQNQQKKITPPRLGILTSSEKPAGLTKDTGVVKVESVAPGSLGDQIGFAKNDVIDWVRVEGMTGTIEVRSPEDVFRWLSEIARATGANKEQSAKVTVSVRGEAAARQLQGAVIRLNVTDSKDGGPLYYFKKAAAK